MKKCMIVLLFVFAVSAGARAAAVRDLNLEDLCRGAGRIFWGVCTGAQVNDTDLVYTFKAHRFLKGGADGAVTLRMHRLASTYARAPQFVKGQEVLLFLHPESRLGYSSPVGFGQGVFTMSKNGDETMAANERNNRLLFRGMNMDSLCPGSSLSGIRQASMIGAGPLRQREFLELIEKIVKNQ